MTGAAARPSLPRMTSRRVPPPQEPNAWTRRLAALRAAGAPVADLTLADPTRLGLAPLEEAAAALAAVWPDPYDPDPKGAPAARRALAACLAPRWPGAAADDLVLTASTSEGYAHLFRALADPGEAVAVPVPGYPLFEPLARAEGVEARPFRLAWDGRWHLDRDSFERAARGAKAAVLVEPNHPTGSCLGADDRAFVEAVAEREGLALVADEVFLDHPWPGRGPLPSWLGAPRRVPVFVLGGLSKLCGLPHLKLGWIAAAGPAAERARALAALEWVSDLFLAVGGPVQAALPALLELRGGFRARVRERVSANLAALDALARERPEITRLEADGGWTAVLRVPAARSGEAWALALLERGVAVHPGEFYDFERGEHLVVSLVAREEDVRAGCAALAAELARG